MPVALHAATDEFAFQNIEGDKQRGGPVGLIVARHGQATALLDRQTRASAVEDLDLRPLVDRQHDGVGWRVDTKTNDIMQFDSAGGIAGESTILLQAMGPPNPLLPADADADRMPWTPRSSVSPRRADRCR